MRIRIVQASAGAMLMSVLFIGFALGAHSTVRPEIGIGISDEEALMIRGGACMGAGTTDCPSGTCASTSVVVFSRETATEREQNPTGTKYCGGTGDFCNAYWANTVVCGT